MTVVTEVPIGSLEPERFEHVLDRDRYRAFQTAIRRAQDLFAGRIVWNVNSTARGGGVAELLRSLLAYAHGAGVDARWAVIDGAPEFFSVTKRIHNNLHGAPEDGGPLGARELEVYGSVMNRNAEELISLFRGDDVVILHDPQTAGLCVRAKEAVGVIEGFAKYVAPNTDAHLVMAGPDVYAVDDDPEGAEVLNESLAAWKSMPNEARERIHLVLLPMEDGEENAAMVNALQRRASVVVQKSLAEGFGLTVSEAMWKARPVVASKVGGIQEQIIDGRTGLLLADPGDLETFGGLIAELLNDPRRAASIGAEAQGRIRDEFLGPRHLMQYLDLISGLLNI